MADITISFNEFRGDIEKRLGYISGECDLLTLFPTDFMKKYTLSDSIVDFIQDSGLDMTSQYSWDKIQDGYIDSYITGYSNFSSWRDMVEIAYQSLMEQK